MINITSINSIDHKPVVNEHKHYDNYEADNGHHIHDDIHKDDNARFKSNLTWNSFSLTLRTDLSSVRTFLDCFFSSIDFSESCTKSS